MKIICSGGNCRCDRIVYNLLTAMDARDLLTGKIYFQAIDSSKSGKKAFLSIQQCIACDGKTCITTNFMLVPSYY